MLDSGPWYIELQKRGKAPDFQLDLKFRLKTGPSLKDILRSLSLKAFRLYESKKDGFDYYIGTDDYVDYVASLEGRLNKHFTCLNLILVDNDSIQFFRASGGHSLRDYQEDEMKILEALLEAPHLEVVSWRIQNSGDGLKGDILHEAGSGNELREYLHSLLFYIK
jgi:hypothetical protein